jgi:tetratricopeptide (TPR) repeat protein
MSFPKLVSLSRWRREAFLALVPPVLFLGLAGVMILGERNPSVPQLLGVILLAVLALSWSVPDLLKKVRVFSQVQALNGELAEGLRLLEAGKNAAAQQAFEQVVAQNPQAPAFQATALQNAAVCCLRQGDFAGARERFDMVIGSGWGNHWRLQGGLGVVSLNGLAMLEALEGQLSEAKRLQKLALARLPQRGRAPFRLVDGLIAIREGRYEDAVKTLEECKEAASASGVRLAVIQALGGFVASQQGTPTTAPADVLWLGTTWPEMKRWLQEAKCVDAAPQQGDPPPLPATLP